MCASSCYGKSEIDKSLMHRDLPTIGIVSIMAKCQPHWIQIGETGISMYMMWYVYTNLCLSTATPHQVRMFYSIFFVRSLSLETPIKIIKGLPHIHIFLFFSCTAFPDLKPRKMPIQWQSQQHISLLPMGMAPLPLLWLVQVLLVALALAQVLALAPVSGAGAGGAGTSTRPWPGKLKNKRKNKAWWNQINVSDSFLTKRSWPRKVRPTFLTLKTPPLASPSEIWRWHIPVVDARVVSPPDLHSKTCPAQLVFVVKICKPSTDDGPLLMSTSLEGPNSRPIGFLYTQFV